MAKERRKTDEEVTIVSNVHPLFSTIFEVYMPQPTIQDVSALEDEEEKENNK